MNNIGKKNTKMTIIVTILIISLLGTTYAYINLNNQPNNATGQAGCFVVNYSAQEINATNLTTTTNYEDGATTTVTLSQNTDCKIYTTASIYIHTDSSTTAPISNPQALKFKIYNGTTLINEGTISQTASDTAIATGLPLSTTATTYTIYIWIDSNISLGAYDAKTYSGYIYADSTQTSTIK